MSIFSKFLRIFSRNLVRKNPTNNPPQKNLAQKRTRDFSTAILQSALKALAFFAFLYAIDAIFRAIFILNIGILERHLGSAESSEFLQAFINGARYFGQIAGVLASVAFVLFLCGIWRRIFNKIAFIFIAFVICLLCFVNIANMGFYATYGDVFNANLLGLIFDDRSAIFATAQGGQYNLILKIILWILSSVIFVLIFYKITEIIARFCESRNLAQKSRKLRRICAFFAFFIFVFSALFAINGQFGLKGISLGKEIRPTTNAFLRKISTGALRDLYLVFRAYKKITNSKFSDFIDETPAQAARNVAKFMGVKLRDENKINLLDLLQRRVGGGQKSQNLVEKSQNLENISQNLAQNPQIQHIFYIIAESMSEWHFEEIFDEIELSSELKKLVRENGAYKAQTFIQNAGNTIASLNVQISGLPQTDIPLSLLSGRVRDLQSAPAVIMRDLGFEGSFFYGGSGTWQKLDSYVTTQGFKEILFGTHIVENTRTKGYSAPYQNSWGAYDNHLFAFVRDKTLEKVRQNPQIRTFNMIMTTSNHPPYDAPVAEFGAPFKKIEKFIEAHKDLRKKPITAQLLAHIWWQDKLIAGFVREMSAKFPRSVFVITGDHYDREYPFTPSLRVSQSVPFIVYAPSLALEVRANVGAHIDITPTIVEIVAVSGFEYYSFGKALVRRSNSPLSAGNSPLDLHSSDFANLGRFADLSPVSHPKFAKNHESQTENPSVVDSALAQNLGENQTKIAESNLDSADSTHGANSTIADEFLGFCEASDKDKTKVCRGSEPKQSLKSRCESKFALDSADFAFGFNIIATNNFIFDGFNVESFDEKKGDKALAQEYFKHLQRARALSWWILQKGWVVE